MKRLIETLAFVALAIGVHLALVLRFDQSDGTESGGQGGGAMVSIAAASASVETMVAKWEAPPQTSQTTARPVAPAAVLSEPTPTRPDTRPELAPSRRAALSLPSAPAHTPTQPQIELSTPPPPEPEPEPKQSVSPAPLEPVPEVSRQPTASKRPVLRPTTKIQPKPAPQVSQKLKKAEPARPASGSTKAQTSAGSGGSTQAGASGQSSVKTLGKSQRARLQTVWGGKIRARVERQKRFPRGTRAKGRVVLRITVGRDGRVISTSIARSSGQAAFDKAALSAVSRAGRMPQAPKGLGKARYTFNLPVDFQ